MPQSYVFSFTSAEGTTFTFDETHGFDSIDAEDLSHLIPTGDTEGADGEYQADSSLGPRTLTVSGTVVGDTPFEVWTRTQELMAGFPKGGEGRFRAKILDSDGTTELTDIFLPCRVAGRRIAERRDEADARDFALSFRSSGSWWWDWDLQTAATLPQAGGTTLITPGGSEWAAPIITLVVSTPGTITLTPAMVSSGSAESIVIEATTAATYVLDNAALTLTRGGGAVDALGEIVSGGFFDIPATASNLTLALAGGAVLSSAASVQWRRRWSFGV